MSLRAALADLGPLRIVAALAAGVAFFPALRAWMVALALASIALGGQP